MLELAGRLGSEEQLRPVFAHARVHKLVAIDFAGVSRIDFELAPKLCAALRLFALQSKRVMLTHVSPLHAQLLTMIGLHPGVALLARRCAAEERELSYPRVLQAA
jgi:anti-anti-sigma regulatory factor